MTIWLDIHPPPALATWMRAALDIDCVPVRELNLQTAPDGAIFHAARQSGVIVMTKDADFLILLEQYGPPPQVIWVTCGNTSNKHLKSLVESGWRTILPMLERGEVLVELCDAKPTEP